MLLPSSLAILFESESCSSNQTPLSPFRDVMDFTSSNHDNENDSYGSEEQPPKEEEFINRNTCLLLNNPLVSSL